MILTRPKALCEDMKYCGGCGHGILNRLVAELLEETHDDQNALCAVAVGCACWMPDTFGVDIVQAQHGRAAAVASGMKRFRPDKLVFAYQGEGDALAIGLAETMYAAIRNENITVILVNNTNFGMTGGQMSPTTLAGQRTATSRYGRDTKKTGEPLNIIPMLMTRDVAYLARGAVIDNATIRQTKRMLRTAFGMQKAGMGYSLVEVLSPCPTNWGMRPAEACAHIRNAVESVYPLGEFVKKEARV